MLGVTGGSGVKVAVGGNHTIVAVGEGVGGPGVSVGKGGNSVAWGKQLTRNTAIPLARKITPMISNARFMVADKFTISQFCDVKLNQ
jgi:hypothetical protein